MRMSTGYFVVLAILSGPCTALAQATTSSAGTTSAPGVTYKVMGSTDSSKALAQAPSKSPHVADPGGPPPDEVNRRALEPHPGSTGGELLLRSVPDGAQVFVDGAFVGRTPLLLIVAPGKYKIRMRGPRDSIGERTVELAAKESQQIALTLTPRYPDHVVAR